MLVVCLLRKTFDQLYETLGNLIHDTQNYFHINDDDVIAMMLAAGVLYEKYTYLYSEWEITHFQL